MIQEKTRGQERLQILGVWSRTERAGPRGAMLWGHHQGSAPCPVISEHTISPSGPSISSSMQDQAASQSDNLASLLTLGNPVSLSSLQLAGEQKVPPRSHLSG